MAKNRREENLDKIRKMGEQVRQGGTTTHTFEVDYETPGGTLYQGNVTVKRPNMRDYINMGVQKARFLNDQIEGPNPVPLEYIDDSIKYLAQVIGDLEVLLVSRPPWLLKLDEVEDFAVLEHVYVEVQTWLHSFRTGTAGQSESDSGTPAGEKTVVDS